MNNRFFISVSILLLFATFGLFTFALATPAFADRPAGGPCGNCRDERPIDADDFSERGPGQHIERLAEVLDLSAEQRAQIEKIVADERAANATIREQLRENREKLRELTDSDTFDEAAIRAVAANKSQQKIELMVAHARTRHAINALLTPEQRALADKLRPMMKKGRKGPHGGPEHGPRTEQ